MNMLFSSKYVPWDEIVSEHVNSESLASQLLTTVSHLLRARVAGCEGMWWAEFKILNFLVLNTCEMMLPSLPLPHHHSPEPETEHMWCSSSDLLNTLNIYTKLHLSSIIQFWIQSHASVWVNLYRCLLFFFFLLFFLYVIFWFFWNFFNNSNRLWSWDYLFIVRENVRYASTLLFKPQIDQACESNDSN